MAVRDLGIVTAYGYAVAGGYTGTEQEFTALLGDLALTVEDLENMTVSVTTLEPDQQATASYADGVLSLGIPRGRNGEVTQDDLDEQLENYATNEDLLGAYIVKSASGDIASFSDGGDDIPMKSLKVAITPKQSGSGDPSPSNVRPITGSSTANVHVTGKNMWSDVFSEWTTPNDYSIYKLPLEQGKRYTVTCRLTGTAVTGTTVGITRKGNKYSEFDTPPNWRYIATDGSIPVSQVTYTIDSTWTDPALIMYVANNAQNYQNVFDNYEIQIEEGATATAYEPYTGHTTPVPLGQTVYGGEVDVATGELTIDRIMVSGWTQFNQNNGYKAYRADNLPSGQGYNLQNEPMCNMVNEYGSFSSGSMDRNIIQVPSSTATQAYMALDENIDPTTVQFTYKIGTLQTVQLTPAEVRTLLGQNNVWSDAGDIEVAYRADTKMYIDNKFAELQALVLENN